MTTKEFRETLNAKGFDASKMDETMLKSVAKNLGIVLAGEPKAEIVEHTTGGGRKGMYVKAPGVQYVGLDGKTATSMPPFVPLMALEQTISNLQYGLNLAKEKGLIK